MFCSCQKSTTTAWTNQTRVHSDRLLAGSYSGIGFGSLVRPDSGVGRTFFLTGSNSTRSILAFDQRTFALIGSMEITGVSGTPTSFIRWGSDGLAFGTTGGQLFLVRSPLVSGAPEATMTPTSTPVVEEPVPTAIPTEEPAPSPPPSPIPTSTPAPTPTPVITLHVADLDGVSARLKNTWGATVTVAVHDSNHNPVEGATVTGNWTGADSGPTWCTTGSDGRCQVGTMGLSRKESTITFAMNGVSRGALAYQPSANHDPDGDSDGTSLTVLKP